MDNFVSVSPIKPPRHDEVIVNTPGLKIRDLEGASNEGQDDGSDLDSEIQRIADEVTPESVQHATEKLRKHMEEVSSKEEEAATQEDSFVEPEQSLSQEQEVQEQPSVSVEPIVLEDNDEDSTPEVVENNSKAPAAATTITEEDVAAPEIEIDESQVVSSATGLDVEEAVRLFTNRNNTIPGVQVLALHTGFCVEMTSLSFREINAMQASLTDNYTQRYKMIQIVYNRMQNCTVKMTFEQFLKNTAFSDLNTLLYGLYASTYPDKHEFKVRCQNEECGVDLRFNRYPSDLVQDMPNRTIARIKDLLEAKRLDEARKESILGKVQRRELPDSGIVVEIRNPTLKDYLDSTQRHVQEEKKKSDDSTTAALVTIQMYLKKILLPGKMRGVAEQSYLPINRPAHVMHIVSSLSSKDGDALLKAIMFESSKYDVEYCLPEYSCPQCGFDNKKTPMNFESILFLEMMK